MSRVFAKVDPKEIVIDPRYVKPTEWDLKVVEEDLYRYVQLSRVIKGLPVLRVLDDTLILVSGAPFVRAARKVVPPLTRVACRLESDEELVRSLGLEIVTVSQLIDESPSDEVYEAVELLAFSRPLTDLEKTAVQEQIQAVFQEVNTSPSKYGGDYSSISQFEWDEANRRIHWTWQRNDQLSRASSMFMELIGNLNRTVAPVSSWNGLFPSEIL